MTTAVALPHRRSTLNDDPPGLSPHEFESFVVDYAERLLTVAKKILRSDEDAADALQDALLAAFASRERFHGNSTVYTWLYRIVVNVCLMKLRSRSRSQSASLEELLPSLDCGNRRPLAPSAWRVIVVDDAEREETRAVVRACIDQLPNGYRTVLLLRDIDEFDTDETAELLGLSTAAVKTRLHRARQALRTLLEPHFS